MIRSPWITTLYATCETLPPHPVAFTAKEYVAAVVGVPLSVSEVVVFDGFAVTPAGREPEAIVHLYGVHPLLAVITAE